MYIKRPFIKSTIIFFIVNIFIVNIFLINLFLVNIFLVKNAYCMTADEIVRKIQDIYDNATDYTADFYQESEMGSLRRVQKALGKVTFKKNGRMYWEYVEPMQQKVISNGVKMWIYQPDMNQVQEFDYKALGMSKTANSFLNGIGKLMNDFNITYEGVQVEGNYVLDLEPKEATVGFASMQMHVNKDSHNIVKTITVDAYSNKNSITFKDIKFDVGILDDFFDFKIPKGVHVVTPPTTQ